MNIPVDPVEQFFSMFAQANAGVWPMQLVWYAAAIAAVVLAIRPVPHAGRLIAAFLAAYYLWLGIVFFGIYYSPISDHALAAGAMFALGGVLWLIAGVIGQDLQFQPRWDVWGVAGGVFMLYALAAYPLIGISTGHVFPAAPVFGLAPCPSVIFTAGLLLWTRPRMPMYVVVVPLFWLLAQTPADALAIGVVADVARPVVGVIATGLLIWREYADLRNRLIAYALLALAVLWLGQDVLLMALGCIFLAGGLIWWFIRRPVGRVPGDRTVEAT